MEKRMDKYKAAKRFRLVRTLALLAVLLFLMFRFVIGVAPVSGASMLPTLEDGDIVIFSRLFRSVERGDVVAIALPSGEKYVKRVVAVAGDTVDIKDGVLYINGIAEESADSTFAEEGNFSYPYSVQEGDVFTLGDNRTESVDSRFYGAVSMHEIRGVLLLKISGLAVSKINQ